MNRVLRFAVAIVLGCGLLAPHFSRGAESPDDNGGPRRQSERRWTRYWRGNATNNASVKAAFREATSGVASGTVRILADGDAAALGVILDTQGHIVTKASDLFGELKCRFGEGREYAATLVASDEQYDLAVLKVDAENLSPAEWRTDDVAPPGSFVACVGPGDELIAVGVVSAEPRQVRGSTQPEGRRGWLGISLGGDEDGIGISAVMRGSAAEEAELEPGDRILAIDGTAMGDVEQVVETVGSNPPGQTIQLVVQRDGEEIQVEAKLKKPEPRRLPQDHWGGGPFSARRSGFPIALPHDAVIRPSDCGGPLVDTDGRIVGINIARALRVTTYALPADVVLEVAGELIAQAK